MDKYAIVIAGPSGVGKTTVTERLISELGFLRESRSVTTRQPRNDGNDGEYVYLTADEFRRYIELGEVIEYTEYGGNFYGTVRFELERIFNEGKIPILILDYNGARSLRALVDYPVYSFYLYTTLEEAARRLESRDLTAAPDIERAKAAVARRKAENIADYRKMRTMTELFDAFVENRNLDICVAEIISSLEVLRRGDVAMTDGEKRLITERLFCDAE